MTDRFHRLAILCSKAIGSPPAFLSAFGGVILWAAMGPSFHYSETWQMVINTATTIITFLVVFLLQATQNRDAQAMQLKLDELIRVSNARNRLVGLESLSDGQMEALQKEFDEIRKGEDKENGERPRNG